MTETITHPQPFAAALAEFERWTTCSDTRRPEGRRTWVARLDDADTYIETTSHADVREALTACHMQALAAAMTVGMAALSGHRIIEAADTGGFTPLRIPYGTLALTMVWPDGAETRELVTERAAAALGYVAEPA